VLSTTARRPRASCRSATTRCVSESRSSTTLGISKGQLPAKEYYGRWRTFPTPVDYSFQEQKPTGTTAHLLRRPVLRGRLQLQPTPSWCRRGAGQSMFEALNARPSRARERWGPRRLGLNHRGRSRPRSTTGSSTRGYGVWGFSPSNTAEGGLRDLRRRRGRCMDPNGNPLQRGPLQLGRPGLRRLRRRGRPPGPAGPGAQRLHQRRRHPARPRPGPCATRRASARRPHAKLQQSPTCTGSGASATASTSRPARPSGSYLSLDQGMIMAALATRWAGMPCGTRFSGRQEEHALRP